MARDRQREISPMGGVNSITLILIKEIQMERGRLELGFTGRSVFFNGWNGTVREFKGR